MTQVRIDHADDGRARGFEACDDRGPESEFAAPVNDLQLVLPGELISQRPCAVWRVVVHDNQLGIESGRPVRTKHCRHEIGEPIALVVGGNDDGERGSLRRVGDQRMRLPRTIIQPTLDE